MLQRSLAFFMHFNLVVQIKPKTAINTIFTKFVSVKHYWFGGKCNLQLSVYCLISPFSIWENDNLPNKWQKGII